jgi:hypothetical protein
MTIATVLSQPSISRSKLWGGMLAIWIAASGLVFPIAWILRPMQIQSDWRYWGSYLILAVLAFPFLYWIAGARWPSSSRVSRFGFAAGLAILNCPLAFATAYLVGTLFFHG